MDDELWTADHQTEHLRTVRSEGSVVWSDSAAREVSTRWLDPHDRLAEQLVGASRDQSLALKTAQREQSEADASAQVALARANDVFTWIAQLGESTLRCAQACAEAADATARAVTTAAEARQAVARAGQILAEAR